MESKSSKEAWEREQKHLCILVVIMAAWGGIVIGGMELFPDMKLLIRSWWYIIGGIGAALMFYVDIQRKNNIAQQVLAYFFMVMAGPFATLTLITYWKLMIEAHKRRIAWLL